MDQSQISVEQFGCLTAYDDTGEEVTFSGLWKEGAAIFVFVRHFG